MTDQSITLGVLYVIGDLLFALLAGLVLVVPLAIPVALWWLRRGSATPDPL